MEREVTSCSPCHLSVIFDQTFASVISLLQSSPVWSDTAKWHLRTLEEETGLISLALGQQHLRSQTGSLSGLLVFKVLCLVSSAWLKEGLWCGC